MLVIVSKQKTSL